VNVYFVSAGEVTDQPSEWEPPETYVVCDLVAADTRSQARYELWRSEERVLGDLSEQHWAETRVVAKGVERVRGRLKYNDPLWNVTCPEHMGRPCVCELLAEGPPWQCEECGSFETVAEIEFSTTVGQAGRRLCMSCLL
jgi:hypothetical protein